MREIIQDYTVTDVIREESNIALLRAIRPGEGKASLKIIKKSLATQAQIRDLNQEFEIEKQIASSHAVHAYELVSTEELLGFSMEELPRMDLHDYLNTPSTDFEERLAIAVDLSQGIGEIHLGGIAHRGLTSTHIYVDPEQKKIKIGDFGNATAFPSEEDYATDITALGTLLTSLFEPFEISQLLAKIIQRALNGDYHTPFSVAQDLKKVVKALSSNQPGHLPLNSAVYDHFHAPKRLYGRQSELYAISQWCSDVWNGDRLFLILSGPLGIGKSALAAAAGENVQLRQGRYVEVQFDPIQKNLPYKPFSKALAALFAQIALEPEDKFRETRKRIQTALGHNSQAIAEIVPEIESLIPKQDWPNVLTAQENHNRLRFLLIQLFKALIEPERPLVLFLDNLEYADESSLGLAKDLINDTQIQYLFIICAFDNRPTSPTFKDIASKKENIVTLHLNPLAYDSLFEMVLEIVPMTSLEQSQKFATDLYEKSAGNPYYALQLIKLACEESLLQFDPDNLVWKGDTGRIKQFLDEISLDELDLRHLPKLNANYLNLLKFAQALELPPAKDLLCEMTGQTPEEVEKGLLTLMRFGLVNRKRVLRNQDLLFYKEDERDKLHLQIARALHKKAGSKTSLETAFYYKDIPKELFQQEETIPIASLFLEAGLNAKNRGAYPLAIHYFTKGISLLPENCWSSHLKLTGSLKQQLGTTLVVNGNYQAAEKVLEECVAQVLDPSDRCQVYREMVFLYGNLREFQKLFDTAKKALACYNFRLDEKTSQYSLLKSYLSLKYKMLNRTWDELTELPEVQDPAILQILSLLSLLFFPAYLTNNKTLFFKTAIDMINLTIDHGSSYFAPIPLATYAMILGSSLFNDFENSAVCGAAALKLTKRYPKKAEIGGAICTYYSFIHRWKHPLRESIPPLRENLRLSLETGSGFVGTTNATYLNLISLLVGDPLEQVQKNLQYSINELKKFSTRGDEQLLFVHREACRALRGLTNDFTDPFPPEFNDPDATIHPLSELRYKIWRTILLTIFNCSQEAVAVGDKVLLDQHQYPNWPEWNSFYFYYALALAASIKTGQIDQMRWKKLQQAYKKLKRWAAAAPQNYAHHAHLVSAEIARLKGRVRDAQTAYAEAVKTALDNGFIHEAALALEHFGIFAIAQGQKEQASIYFSQAFQLFSKWGAEAKKREFRLTYSNYLEQLTFQDKLGEEERVTLTATFGNDFDVNALLESSISLTQEIQLKNLADTILALGENTGGEKSHLILNREKNAILIASKKKDEPSILHTDPASIEANQHQLPLAAVKNVLRSKSLYRITDPHLEEGFQQDPYVLSHKPKNILTLPFIHKGELSGVLYLENSQTENPFTREKISNLQLLAPQIAIALENAQYYEKIEKRVQERSSELLLRNTELSQALQNVEKLHGQQLQQQKLASLGLLSSGIAHELKNPLNFIINFSEVASDQLKELEVDLTKEIGFEETLADLQASIAKIDAHSKRADAILKRMLEHGRSDSQFTPVDLDSLIEQAFELSYGAYQKKAPVFYVEFIKTFSRLPKVLVQPNDLMRVFINLFDNAFYAMDQKLRLNPGFKPQLSVATRLEKDQAIIQITDNGVGISKELLKKAFQPFFTTKPAGSGTGLGLSIAYDIIAKQHHGSIQVQSEAGQRTAFILALPLEGGEA